MLHSTGKGSAEKEARRERSKRRGVDEKGGVYAADSLTILGP